MTSPSSDRNFLFALVAYQNGYITIEQFFEAAQIWNKDPKKDIGDILVERKFIDDVERFNIQGIVEDRLRRQGGIDNSLSYVVENGSVPQGEDLPEAWQEKFSQITKVSDDSVKSPVSKATSGPSIHRYLFRRPIGEGGHARGVIASLLLLGLTAAALLWATTFSLKKSNDLNIANTNLLAQQKVTKASRDALSTVLDDVVGSIFDDQMSQIPDIDKSRIKMLKAAIDEMQKFVDKYPDDWDLKLDVVRLLTRLGHLQSDTDPMGASETFHRSSEFIAQAKDVPNEKIRRSNWLGSAIDSEYYRGAFLLETKKDDQAAMQANQVCFELAEELVKHEGRDEGNHGVMCRLHSQKALILQHQDRFDEALVHADLGVEAMSGFFGGRFLQEELSKERVKEIDYADILLYMIALDQRCTVLKNLNRRSEYSKSLRDLLRCCQIAEQIPTAQRDARVYGTKTLGELYRIAISDHDASAAQRYYEQALEGIEKGIDDSTVVQVAMMFETDRATLLAPMDIDKAIEAISKAQEYLDELTPSESQTDESQKLWYMSVKIYFNDAKLAVLLAQGKQQEHEQLRQEQSELEHQFELLENKLSGKETKQ